MKAAVPRVPPPVGMVRVAPATGQVKVPAPPLLVRAVVKVALVTVPALPPIERLATGVVEVTEKGAVPMAIFEINCVPVIVPSAKILLSPASESPPTCKPPLMESVESGFVVPMPNLLLVAS